MVTPKGSLNIIIRLTCQSLHANKYSTTLESKQNRGIYVATIHHHSMTETLNYFHPGETTPCKYTLMKSH